MFYEELGKMLALSDGAYCPVFLANLNSGVVRTCCLAGNELFKMVKNRQKTTSAFCLQ